MNTELVNNIRSTFVKHPLLKEVLVKERSRIVYNKDGTTSTLNMDQYELRPIFYPCKCQGYVLRLEKEYPWGQNPTVADKFIEDNKTTVEEVTEIMGRVMEPELKAVKEICKKTHTK